MKSCFIDSRKPKNYINFPRKGKAEILKESDHFYDRIRKSFKGEGDIMTTPEGSTSCARGNTNRNKSIN